MRLGIGLGVGRGRAVASPPEESFVGALDSLPVEDLALLVTALDPGRRLFASYEGPLVRIRRVDDDEEMDFGAAADGTLDTAAIDTWLDGSAGALVTVYDQVGSNDYTQATEASQPIYSASVAAINDKPGFLGDTADGLYGPVPVTSRPFAICTTFCPTTSYGGSDYLWAITGSNPGYNLFITATGPLFRARNGAAISDAQGTTAPVQNTPGYVEAIEASATSRSVRMNGTGLGTNTTSSTPGFTGTASYGNIVGGGNNAMAGYMLTHLGFEGTLSLEARNLIGNASEWYGVSYTEILS